MLRRGTRAQVSPIQPDGMTVEQYSVCIQIAKSTHYRLAQEGKHWRYRRDAVDRRIEAQPAGPDLMNPHFEVDTYRENIVPMLTDAGWENEPHSIAEQRSLADGQIIVAVGKVRGGNQT